MGGETGNNITPTDIHAQFLLQRQSTADLDLHLLRCALADRQVVLRLT